MRVGVVGLGEVAQIIHLPILEALGERYEIGAICDISPGLLRAIGERYGVERRYNDAAELAAQTDLDAVFVLNSDEFHAESAIAALRHGKHVLIEKPMTLTLADADAIIRERDTAGVQVMVGYMRRFAPAFEQARERIHQLEKINYVRVRDIIGQNALIIEQSSTVLRFNDMPPHFADIRAARAEEMVREAIGAARPDLRSAYRFLCGLGSHDLSALRELIGFPRRVVAAAQWNGGRFLNVIFAYDGFCALFETGVDWQRRFDAHLEVYGPTASLRVQYDTPYIRHLPTTLVLQETIGEAYQVSELRPTFKDPYTHELETFYDTVVRGVPPKTTPEDFKEDLRLFRMIIDALRAAEPDGVNQD